ncbi:DUF3883 domain-containing protein [Egicoccus sp. AB-alg6-2]|uniref:DUF3883 domain-containing protein n=1 Tax=Egicoccus sp. AB-alg6-2 TaxID=3242692 RepID=UPI00359D2706
MEWELQPGDTILRKHLHEQYGGSGQGGINPTRSSDNVFVFTDPETGPQYGYLDRWEEGIFHYTGEGQKGPQSMKAGNKRIRDHTQDGKALRVFDGSRGEVLYMGEFALDTSNPWYFAKAPEFQNPDVLRRVIMFRMVPVGLISTPQGVVVAGHQPMAEETELAATAVAKLAGDGAGSGQGFANNAKVRRAVELRAMALAEQHYQSQGWSIDDVSANHSYDLRATRNGVELHIEVKGTQSRGQEVLLTPNEVAHARAYPDVSLVVVHSIAVTETKTQVVADGGELAVYDPWLIDTGDLAALGYAYTVPGVPDSAS